ncbi:uncharacterized protein LOC123530323 [Mercenaria mercenaria]|uniref:uncharacterized protein LOC123530323 n=1 Tax=Mercenaria mercenaria TaxID=6596 RepID=UPI00234F97EF|nr:uncharacterized protein LOC123530323 [Mercenaria mercenaria]
MEHQHYVQPQCFQIRATRDIHNKEVEETGQNLIPSGLLEIPVLESFTCTIRLKEIPVMSTFQTAAMNTVKISCILFILKVTQCIDGQIPDANWPLGYNYIRRSPYEAKGLVRHLASLYAQPQITKRRLDRFRFFHKGLGKRSPGSAVVNTKIMAGNQDNSNIFADMRKVLDEASKFHIPRPYDQQYLFETNPNMFLKNTRAFRRLLGMNYLYNKRAPEIFSENLYPLQSGKQKLEATLDQTLDNNEESYDNGIDYDDNGDDAVENIPIKPEMMDDITRDKMATKTPFDLIFATPDVKTDTKLPNKLEIGDHEEANINDGQRSKRWWAANMFRKFRSPKSWNHGVKHAQHADPALYFVGLGR